MKITDSDIKSAKSSSREDMVLNGLQNPYACRSKQNKENIQYDYFWFLKCSREYDLDKIDKKL